MSEDIQIILGNCKDVLKKIEPGSVQLIITSPPYGDKRNHTYGGIHPDQYVKWFRPISKQLYKVLDDEGTFILNIKESVVDGQRHTYVIDLIKDLKNHGWLWTEEYIWHKKNSHPGKWPNRFRDGWERLLQFNKNKKFKMYQDKVMVPLGDWHSTRMKSLSVADRQRTQSKVNSGFGRNVSNWAGRELAYPNNVLFLATESSNKSHSAVFPETIPKWFLNLFTEEGDTVLDPFLGSGTTLAVAKKMNRKGIGIEILPEYIDYAKKRISNI